jgi:hypothetical protein
LKPPKAFHFFTRCSVFKGQFGLAYSRYKRLRFLAATLLIYHITACDCKLFLISFLKVS